jgi:hypothetical protein
MVLCGFLFGLLLQLCGSLGKKCIKSTKLRNDQNLLRETENYPKLMNDFGEKVFVFLSLLFFMYLIYTGVSWLFGGNDNSDTELYTEPSSYSRGLFEESDCSALEPDNPYTYGTGHYAGFEWAENNNPGYCDGNSDSFIEGCEDYLYQEEAYEACAY